MNLLSVETYSIYAFFLGLRFLFRAIREICPFINSFSLFW